jgi:mono/diheme cytochrome c family protein
LGGYAVAAVTTAACGFSRRAAAAAVGVLLCGTVGSLLPASFLEPAYATSSYAPAEPYSAASVARGGALYNENCVSCHGSSGRGDGPAAVGLRIRPANLTEPHLFAHSSADLFRWVSRGRANGAMPGFAAALTPGQRWDVINFIRARAAGFLVRELGGEITAAYPVPEFAFEADGVQTTLHRVLKRGPVLLVLSVPSLPSTRLQELAAVRQRLTAAGLQVLAVELGEPAGNAARASAHEVPGSVAVQQFLDDGKLLSCAPPFPCSSPNLDEHCSGCTDPHRESTHQGCTIEHGHVGCQSANLGSTEKAPR